MATHALIERRPWLLASIAAAIANFVLQDSAVPGLYLLVLKGLPVALLAVYALLRHAGRDAGTVAAIMALGAVGDVAIELDLVAGGAAFACAHLVAIVFYLGHRRTRLSPSQRLFALALCVLTPVAAWLLPTDRTMALPIGAYGLTLGAMAGAAWTSSFPRYRVGLGAVLFVASDLLIFAGIGPLAGSVLPGWTVWPLYYTGQFMVCTGVIITLRSRA